MKKLLLLASFTAVGILPANAQDILGGWLISIQVTGGAQIPASISLPVSITELLSLQPGSVIQEQTSGDLLPAVLNSAGFGAWTYDYSSTLQQVAQGYVKFISLATSKEGIALGVRTTTLYLTGAADGSISGSYQATLMDASGNATYQATGTLTGVPLKIDRSGLFGGTGPYFRKGR
jgi:hypothetical protein